MKSRIIVAAMFALTAFTGAAHAEIAPAYNAYGDCAVYALSVHPRFCEDQVGAAATIAVDPVVTGGVKTPVADPRADLREFCEEHHYLGFCHFAR